MFCRECGRDLGRGWQVAPLGECCKTGIAQREDCLCVYSAPTNSLGWNPRCPVHTHDPYDIPF